MQDELNQIREELRRIGAQNVLVRLDSEFEPKAGTLVEVRVTDDDAYWHLLPGQLLDLLQELPSTAGAEGVKTTIQRKGTSVWEGPAPQDNREHP